MSGAVARQYLDGSADLLGGCMDASRGVEIEGSSETDVDPGAAAVAGQPGAFGQDLVGPGDMCRHDRNAKARGQQADTLSHRPHATISGACPLREDDDAEAIVHEIRDTLERCPNIG